MMVGRQRNVLGLLCPRRHYIELFYVEQKVEMIIYKQYIYTWNIETKKLGMKNLYQQEV